MKYVVIGASAAAINAVSTLRELDSAGEITVVSKDERVHSRCMIHKVIDGERSVESIDFAGSGFFEKNGAQWIKGRAVTSVDAGSKTVTLDDGINIQFDKLLIATGAVSFIPPVENLRECKEVYCLRDLEDALAIKEAAQNGVQRVVVMGAGLVGMDAVYALLDKGLEIHVIEIADRILPLQLDEYAAGVYQKKFEEKGVTFHLAKKLSKVHMNDKQKLSFIELDDGKLLFCDMILAASGVRPNIAFLNGSGIKTDKGVVVDDYMRTSHKDIFAAGDVTGLSGTWPAAVKQAQTAARNMVRDGQSMYVDRYNMKNTLSFFGIPALSIGQVTPPDESYDVIVRRCGPVYQKLVVKDEMVAGAIFLGDISNKGHWQYIVKNNVSLSGIEKPWLDVSYADFYEISGNDGQYWFAN